MSESAGPSGVYRPMKTTSSTALIAPPANPSQVLWESTGAMGVLPKNRPVKYAMVSPAHVPKTTVRRAAVPTSSCRMSSTALKPRPMYR